MRVISEIRKTFWIINSVLLIILIYIVVSFISGDNSRNSTFADPIPLKEEVEIVPYKNPLPPGDHNIIVERDIFSTSGLYPFRGNIKRENTDALISSVREQFRLRATIAGDDQVAYAVIENLKSKVQDIYKTGDVIEGAKIESIHRNKIALFYGKQHEVFNMRIAYDVSGPVEKNEEPVMAQRQNAPEFINGVLPVKRNVIQKDYITQVPKMEVFLEKMELTPYVVDGEEKGLCITGLDDLSLSRYFGFENGDVIQSVNGQVLTSKQKAFQILKKARSQSDISVQLLRDQHKIDLSFEL